MRHPIHYTVRVSVRYITPSLRKDMLKGHFRLAAGHLENFPQIVAPFI